MGLPVRLVTYAAGADEARDAAAAAFARVAALEAMMSDYRADSELRRLGSGDWVSVSGELFDTLVRAVAIAEATGGAFDPSVGPLVALWREARIARTLPDRAAVDAARTRVGWHKVELDPARRAVRTPPGMRLDLGGIAKGYILQDALRTLRARGVPRALIEAGGDIVAGDAPPGRAGWHIDTPGAEPAFADRASRLVRAALATSGPTAQFVEIDGVRYSHVIDPRTGLGVTNSYVARVIAADAPTADALATALTVLGPGAIPRIAARIPDVTMSVVKDEAASR